MQSMSSSGMILVDTSTLIVRPGLGMRVVAVVALAAPLAGLQ
jgi:hypothetical protein